MPERVESTDPDGVDFGWVMQTTFVLTIVVGAPVVAIASTAVSLPTWTAKAGFAVRVGALVWFLTAIAVFLYARRNEVGGDAEDEADPTPESTPEPAEDD
jgi:membrane protein YdbS with pleckstrin-like domain